MGFEEKEKCEVKGKDLQAKITELRQTYPYLNVCMQRYAPEIYLEEKYIVKIFHNNMFNTDVLVFKRLYEKDN